MNGKIGKHKPKKALTTEVEPEEQLVIQERPVIGHATSMNTMVVEEKQQDDATSSAEPVSAPTLPSQSRRTKIIPISEGAEEAPTSDKEAAVTDVAPEDPKAPQKEALSKDEAVETKVEPEANKSSDASAKKPADDEPKEDAVPEDEEVTDGKDEKPNPETEKAIAEAAAAAKRQSELESLIDSKQFNVPINAVARKREVKHSALMTVAILLLGLILIDLMLDSGVIFLAEKIPHTHFFTTNSSN
jgi:hypothetical protein